MIYSIAHKINSNCRRFFILLLLLSFRIYPLLSQVSPLSQELDLSACINYALGHFPALQQGQLDYQITSLQVANQQAKYLPQLNLLADYQHTIQRRRSIVGNQVIAFGPKNNNDFAFNLQQPIFKASLYHSLISARPQRELAKQEISAIRIGVIVQVSYAFYDVLYAMEQIRVLQGDMLRLERSFQDASSRYKVGATDNLDELRARLSVNNKQAAIKQAENNLRTRYAILKNAMGMPNSVTLKLRYDSLSLERDATEIFAEKPRVEERNEYQQLILQQQLAQQNVLFHNLNHLPSLVANAGYNLIFQENNNVLKAMYQTLVPYSYVSLQLNWSLFEGFSKRRNLQQAKLTVQRNQWDLRQFHHSQNTEYAQAMAQYNSDLASYQMLRENLKLSEQVYQTIRKQYLAGIKTYLEVVVAESELSELRTLYIATLFQLLKDKVEIARALGKIK